VLPAMDYHFIFYSGFLLLTEILAPENFLRNRCDRCVDGRSPDFST
jgi:hypothetical protein